MKFWRLLFSERGTASVCLPLPRLTPLHELEKLHLRGWLLLGGGRGGSHGKPSLNERGRNTNTQIPRGFKIMQSGAKAFAFFSLSATDVGVQV